MHSILAFVASLALLAPFQDTPTTAIGVPVSFREIVLDGIELEVAPSDDKTPVALRIVSASPHGTSTRYDFEVYGLEAGTFNVIDFLIGKDGSAPADLEPLSFEVTSTLEPGFVTPNRLQGGTTGGVGGYRLKWIFGGAIWLLGMVALLKSRRAEEQLAAATEVRPLTFAERLRPLIQRGMDGKLEQHEGAELELMLLAHWRKRMSLGEMPAAEALATMKQHEQAGPLISQLELWLHSPGQTAPADMDALLGPYRQIEAEGAE